MAGAIGIVFGLCVLSFTLGAALMYVVQRRREDAAAGVSSPADEPVERTWVEKPAAVEPVDEDYDSRPIYRNPVMGLPQLEPALAILADPVPTPDVAMPDVAMPDVAVRDSAVRDSAVRDSAVRDSAVRDTAVRDVATRDVAARETGEPETVGAARYDRDGDLDPPLGKLEAPESTVALSTDSSEAVEPVAEAEPDAMAVPDAMPEPIAEAELEIEPDAEAEPDAMAVPVAEPVAEPVVTTALPPPAAPQPVEHTTWVEREDFRQRYLRTFEEVRRKAGSN